MCPAQGSKRPLRQLRGDDLRDLGVEASHCTLDTRSLLVMLYLERVDCVEAQGTLLLVL